MRTMNFVLAFVVVFASAQAFADHDSPNGPCKAYWESCKSDASVKDHKSMHKCVVAAAKAANNEACVTAIKKHEGDMHGKMKGGKMDSSGAAPAPSTPPASQ